MRGKIGIGGIPGDSADFFAAPPALRAKFNLYSLAGDGI